MRCFIATVLCCAGWAASGQVTAPAPAPAANNSDPIALQSQVDRMKKSLRDYGNLARYHDEDVKLSAEGTGEGRVVFMGDSITDFWGRQRGKFFPGKPYVNRGISGQVTPQMLLRFYQDVIDLRPKIVVILAGTNDIGGSAGPIPTQATENNLRAMVEIARAHNIRVVLSSLTPVSDYLQPQTGKRPPEKIIALNQWIEKYAAENQLVFLDYYPAMVDEKGMLRKELTVDGLHPNDAGYEVMAPLAAEAIQKALAGSSDSH
jgi:lysophospholipase L1-like esterase